MKTFLKQNQLSLALLTVLAFAVYANSLGNAFLSDDLPEIVNNPQIGNLWYTIKTHPFGFIRLVFYWIVFEIAGLNQAAFRLINLLLHMGNIYLIYAIISLLTGRRVAFFTAAVFAVHPLLIESVAWISGGGYAQYAFFFLLSFLLYIKSAGNTKLYILSILSYLFSFMSHLHMPISLVLVYPLYELTWGKFGNWKRTIPFAVVGLIYVIISLTSLPAREQTLKSVHYQERGVDNIFQLVPVAITSYLNLIFFPKDLTLYHSELAFGNSAFLVIALEFIIFIAAWAFFAKKDRKVFFWISFFVISLLPTLTPFRLNWIVAERYAYLGSIGIFASVVYLLEKGADKFNLKSYFYPFLVVVLVMLSARTIARNIDWKNEDNLWIATGKTSPSSPNTHNNLGDVYGRQGNKQAALREFQKAIEIKPNYADAYHNLANTYHELGQDNSALENYQKALEFNPGLWQSYQNIAAILFSEKQYDKALEYMQKAMQVNPGNIQLRNNMGVIYLAAGRKEEAKEIFKLVLSIDPKNQSARQGLAEANKP